MHTQKAIDAENEISPDYNRFYKKQSIRNKFIRLSPYIILAACLIGFAGYKAYGLLNKPEEPVSFPVYADPISDDDFKPKSVRFQSDGINSAVANTNRSIDSLSKIMNAPDADFIETPEE